jgi:hypothetical protein
MRRVRSCCVVHRLVRRSSNCTRSCTSRAIGSRTSKRSPLSLDLYCIQWTKSRRNVSCITLYCSILCTYRGEKIVSRFVSSFCIDDGLVFRSAGHVTIFTTVGIEVDLVVGRVGLIMLIDHRVLVAVLGSCFVWLGSKSFVCVEYCETES